MEKKSMSEDFSLFHPPVLPATSCLAGNVITQHTPTKQVTHEAIEQGWIPIGLAQDWLSHFRLIGDYV
jgi:hypothetical protein